MNFHDATAIIVPATNSAMTRHAKKLVCALGESPNRKVSIGEFFDYLTAVFVLILVDRSLNVDLVGTSPSINALMDTRKQMFGCLFAKFRFSPALLLAHALSVSLQPLFNLSVMAWR